MRPLSEQVVLICGASGGIGRAIAKRLSDHGTKLALQYYTSQSETEMLAHECRSNGGYALPIYANITDKQSVLRMVQTVVERWDTVDSVIYCSGIGKEGLFQYMTDSDYDEVMDVHVRGAFYTLQAVFPYMQRQRAGRVVIMSSIWGSSGGAGEVLYSMAKGALNSLTKALAKEWATIGITVNAIAPGAVETSMNEWMSEMDRSVTEAQIPIDRFARPDEIAYWAEQLCRPENTYMTGHILHVNGGWFTP